MITVKDNIKFDNVLQEIDRITDLALRAAIVPVEQDIKNFTPVDTGNTVSTVRSEVKDSVGIISAGGAMEHLEFGTKYIAGGRVKSWKPGKSPITSWPALRARAGARQKMPPMRSALYENRKTIQEIYAKVFKEKLK